MKRFIEQDFESWLRHPDRKPLIVHGARQVGKSYSIEQFGKHHFTSFVIVNFEFERRFITCFESLDPEKIVRSIETIANQPIVPGQTLLFLDEIQEAPNAILSLRYFKEKMPNLHVIAAGSLLEFVLNQPKFRMPVGRVDSLYMKPCTFEEFLEGVGRERLTNYLKSVSLQNPVEEGIHALLIEQVHQYFAIGGMPELVVNYSKQANYLDSQRKQAILLEYYRRDFGKYDARIKTRYLQLIFDKIPTVLAQHFKYSHVSQDIQARDLKPALQGLFAAGLLHPLYCTTASGLPLQATMVDKKFKLFFVDVGLIRQASGLEIQTILNAPLLALNRGALAEQFVAQELIAYSPSYLAPELYYWERTKIGSQAEVDFLSVIDSQIVPIEVKAGKSGHLKSLSVFMKEKKSILGIRISEQPLTFENNILSVPFYLIRHLARLVHEARSSF